MSQSFAPFSESSNRSYPVTSAVEPSQETLARLLGQPIRFGILRALASHEALSFSDLKRLMKITDGNLSMHARKLEDAHVVSCTKGFRGRFPRTEYRLTPEGRRTFEAFAADRQTA